MTIPFLDLAAQHSEIAADVEPAVIDALRKGHFIGGAAVSEFERAYASFVGVDHAVGVGNGTDALELALRALGIGRGDEVILPANTFIATAEAVLRVGADVVVVDVDPGTLLIDVEAALAAVTRRTRAIMAVHLFGRLAPVEALQDALAGTDVVVIEDAAQSQGARRDGRTSGGIGRIAATSFYPGKNLGAAGDAGAVTTQDAELARRVRLMSAHGSERKYEHEVLGFNSRLDAIQAVVLSAKLRRLDAWNSARREAAQRYMKLLANVPEVQLPDQASDDHVWHVFVVQVDERERVQASLAAAGVSTGIHYPTPVHLTPALRDVVTLGSGLAVAERAAGRILSLPMYPQLAPEQIAHVVTALASATSRSREAVPVP